MCLRNTKQTIEDLKELATLIEALHGDYNSPEFHYLNPDIDDLIRRTTGSLLGIATFKDELKNLEDIYSKVHEGIPYKDMLEVDWDAWVHSTILDTEEV